MSAQDSNSASPGHPASEVGGFPPKSLLGLRSLDHPIQPELVFGLVAPIGTPLEGFILQLDEALRGRGYSPCVHKLSDFLEEGAEYTGPVYYGSAKYQRYMRMMTLGDTVRELTQTADILALYAASKITSERPPQEPRHKPGTAHILRQLKHPEEVYRLRSLYGEAFVLMGLYCPREIRIRHLRDSGMSDTEINEVIERDEEESSKWGQKLVETFHLADVFLEVRGAAAERPEYPSLAEALARFVDLLFGRGVVTPSRSEFSMFIAYAAALRSSSLGRQVGAAILSEEEELLSTGTNEVPAYGGGQYWGEKGERDGRDHAIGGDPSDQKRIEMVQEVLSRLDPQWGTFSDEDRDKGVTEALAKLKGTQLLNLTEFMRPVHAEMEALSAAVRIGVRVRNGTLYTTTFPCHNCAKHIVAAGIKQVTYIEPYTKSRALEMYSDAITLDDLDPDVNKVRFLPFVGVAPRRYIELFARSTKEGRRLKAKNAQGEPLAEIGFRLGASPYSYVQREEIAAASLQSLKEEHPNVFSNP
ncbi:MAG: hypothetical protein LC667_16890 [Thioalkalivibrio sp.]|nr:hypothetical protein [Thioalkalivibrio sp.]